jgi:transcriptional regulator with XRE-family HTH domain
MAGSGGNTLRAVLKELGWSRTRLVAELRRQRRGHPGGTESLVAVVSRWVNNHQQPSDFYRDLLARTLGRPRVELFSDEAPSPRPPHDRRAG